MKRIEIESELARIGIRSEAAKLSIKNNSRRAKFRDPEQPVPGARRSAFKVNMQQVREQTGTTGVVEFSRQFVPRGTESAADAVSATDTQKSVMRIYGEGTVANEQVSSTDLGPAASIEWDVGHTKINWSPNELNIEWDENYMPDISVDPHSVEIFMENYPSIKISVVDDGFFITHGRVVDKQV